MEQANSNLPTPVPVAFLICDQVSVELQTGKKTLSGLFDRIWVKVFPTTHGRSTLFARVIDCEGEYQFKFEYVQVSTQTILGEASGTVTCRDRQQYSDLTLPWPAMPLPERGEYEFRLWMNDKFISRSRLTALLMGEMEIQP